MLCWKHLYLGASAHTWALQRKGLRSEHKGSVLIADSLWTCAWVQGIRTIVAMDAYPTDVQRTDAAEAGETWVFYPNDLPKRSAYSGDTRWALTPFLAHQVRKSDDNSFLISVHHTVLRINGFWNAVS